MRRPSGWPGSPSSPARPWRSCCTGRRRWRARPEEVVRAERDLDRVVAVPDGVARWLPEGTVFTVRWLLLHQIEEQARHAGHADVIRESIDGKGAWQLEAEAQGTAAPTWT
ncbi:DUF664 domain-containing protein [Geodermatophilus sp. SYSU D00804]